MDQPSSGRVQAYRIALACVLAAATVGCTEASGAPRLAADKPAVVELLQQSAMYDYGVTDGPAELAKLSDLVVLGRVTDAIEGRTLDAIGPHITLIVSVERTLRNANGYEVAKEVYVEVPSSADVTVGSFRSLVPTDRAVFFLDDRTAIPATGDTGAPAGSPIFAPIPPGPVFQQGDLYVPTYEEIESMSSGWRDHRDFDAFVAATER